jgi:hypothetical protein
VLTPRSGVPKPRASSRTALLFLLKLSRAQSFLRRAQVFYFLDFSFSHVVLAHLKQITQTYQNIDYVRKHLGLPPKKRSFNVNSLTVHDQISRALV